MPKLITLIRANYKIFAVFFSKYPLLHLNLSMNDSPPIVNIAEKLTRRYPLEAETVKRKRKWMKMEQKQRKQKPSARPQHQPCMQGNLPSTVGDKNSQAKCNPRPIANGRRHSTVDGREKRDFPLRGELAPFDFEPKSTLRSARRTLQFGTPGTSTITPKVQVKEEFKAPPFTKPLFDSTLPMAAPLIPLPERTMVDYALPSILGTQSSKTRPMLEANNFDNKPNIIQMLQNQFQFDGLPDEDTNVHRGTY
ncbi:hypothetical protein M9H77_07247 [Catharanthus roseus]|uniref:Uncharacterized protein n=1 Tax=Catharanthus roseus TaxID=4058 RepID=A0ACC0BUC6_CATRO|nr:hypothetical protein M9H77_07247 [Catharanthus roseus]